MHFISTTVVLVAAMATLAVAAPASETRDPAAPINLADVHLTDDQATLETGSSNNGEAAVRDKRTIGPLRQLFPGLSQNEEENQLNGAESKVNEVRVPFKPADAKSADETEEGEEEEQEDLKGAASSDNAADGEQAEELDNETAADEDEDNRNKRFLPFNVGASAGATGAGASASAGSGGGSGNFLFDIIRLVAGSGTTQERDEAETAPADGSTSSAGASASAGEAKDDGYSEGVPGPITRLFVIANRGIANLVQDLILRLAQTSERIVNFKARLITSII